MNILEKSARTLVHSNPFSKVFHVKVNFGQFVKQYYVTHFGPRVGIVVIRDNKILLTRQYRLLPDRLTFEVPGGKVEEGETPERAIVRECLEETGVSCCNLHMLLEYYPGLDNVDNRTSIFYSEEAHEESDFTPDQREVTEIVWMSIEECFEKIYSGAILDALTILGIHSYCRIRSAKSS